MPVRAWVSKATGLPTFYVDGATAVISADGRTITTSSGDAAVVSDVLAPPGVPTIYTAGRERLTLTRRGSTMGEQILTDLTGRGVPGLGAQPVTNLSAWRSDAKVWPSGAARFPNTPPLRTGETQFILRDPAQEERVWGILRGREPVIIGTGAPVPGRQQLMAVVVTDVTPTWMGHVGYQRWNVRWTEYTGFQSGNAASGTRSVVTWGEAQARYRTWGSVGSYLKCARDITGMPQ